MKNRNEKNPVSNKPGYQVVDEKLRDLNEFLKKVDMNQLHDTIKKERANSKEMR